jgi:hypothetical protein
MITHEIVGDDMQAVIRDLGAVLGGLGDLIGGDR